MMVLVRVWWRFSCAAQGGVASW